MWLCVYVLRHARRNPWGWETERKGITNDKNQIEESKNSRKLLGCVCVLFPSHFEIRQTEEKLPYCLVFLWFYVRAYFDQFSRRYFIRNKCLIVVTGKLLSFFVTTKEVN